VAAPVNRSARALALRRGFGSGLLAVAVLAAAAFPARLSVAVRGWGTLAAKAERVLVGGLIDLSAVVLVLAPLVLALAVVVPLLSPRRAGERWQGVGALLAALPAGFLLWVLTVVAQEVKSERGSFPTMFDLAEGGSNVSFVRGTVGYLQYVRVWAPALVGLGLAAAVLVWGWRRSTRGEPGPWRPWALGLGGGLGSGAGAVVAVTLGLASASNRFTSAALGDPLTGLVESSVDLLRHQGPATPRQLVLDAALEPSLSETGAARLGWPPRRDGGAPCFPHPHARPLDATREPSPRDARGRRLVEVLQRVSAALFEAGDGRVAVYLVSLEGFRADDVHALNPLAPREIAPFVSGLYERARAGGQGVLAPSMVYQAGVRTAQGLGAYACGLGTLPYNLSFIRDLHPFPMRCLPDVLAEGGFEGSFFYGSDPTFDGMDVFLKEHRFSTVVGQEAFPPEAPKGTWDGVTDFAVFDEALTRTARGLARGAPQFSLLMSLSHHSPFTTPADLPEEVTARVDAALKTAPNRADADDRLRLLAYSYTDAAVERLFARLDAERMSERSLVLLGADHSTGHAYVWGPEVTETDAQKAQIPLALVVPDAFRARVKDPAALDALLAEAQRLLEEAPLSQNDVPTLVLALLASHPGLASLPESARWHSMGGQVTSPYFAPGGEADSYLLGINGVSELYTLNRAGARTGGYEDSVFLKTRADRYRVTPRLIPVAATLVDVMQRPVTCP
jgi:hypothetical protein